MRDLDIGVIVAGQEQRGSIAQFAAEDVTIAAAAQHDRQATLFRRSRLTEGQDDSAIESEPFGPLTAELAGPKQDTHDVEALLPRHVGTRGFGVADAVPDVALTEADLANDPRRVHVRPYLYGGLVIEPSRASPRAHHSVPKLGAVLRDARKSAGLSAQAVAEASGLSIDTVRSIESGRTASPAFVTVARLAGVLEVSLDRLNAATRADGRKS